MRQCNGFRSFCQCQTQCSIEMHFQESDTANAACIQKLPVIEQLRFFLDWELSLQRPHDTLKHLSIFVVRCSIAGKVDIYAAAGQLCIDFAKRTHLIRPNQDVACPSGILEMFEMIELTL